MDERKEAVGGWKGGSVPGAVVVWQLVMSLHKSHACNYIHVISQYMYILGLHSLYWFPVSKALYGHVHPAEQTEREWMRSIE